MGSNSIGTGEAGCEGAEVSRECEGGVTYSDEGVAGTKSGDEGGEEEEDEGMEDEEETLRMLAALLAARTPCLHEK